MHETYSIGSVDSKDVDTEISEVEVDTLDDDEIAESTESIENEEIEEESTPKNEDNSTKRKIKELIYSLRFPVITILVIGILCGAYSILKDLYMTKRAEMPTSHVYVCDNPEHKSDFDNWLKDDVGLDWVPSYVIIKDGVVIGSFKGDIDESTFSTQLATCSAYNLEVTKLPNYEITNLDGERKVVTDIFTSGIYVLEVAWIDCPDCIHQDDNYTNTIYNKYGTSKFYRYYVRSTADPVKEKYSKAE